MVGRLELLADLPQPEIEIALLAWIFLGEAPGPLGLIGIAAVSAGVYLVQSHRGPGTVTRTAEGPGEEEPGRLSD